MNPTLSQKKKNRSDPITYSHKEEEIKEGLKIL